MLACNCILDFSVHVALVHCIIQYDVLCNTCCCPMFRASIVPRFLEVAVKDLLLCVPSHWVPGFGVRVLCLTALHFQASLASFSSFMMGEAVRE